MCTSPVLMHSILAHVIRRKSWLGLLEQSFWFDKWNACWVQAAAICDSRLK